MKPSFPLLARLFGVIGIVAALSVAVVGQNKPAPSAASPAFSKRTPWGHPDLQGLWTNTTTTPLERPATLGTKATLTDAERAELDARAAQAAERAEANARAARAAATPPPRGNPGAYQDYWFERGSQTNQTSLVVDPPNGRLPALTAKGEAHKKMLDELRYEDSGRSPESYENFDVYDRCITRSMPGAMMPGFYNHNYEIVQTPQYVAIYVEMIHDLRIIPLDGRPRVPGVLQWLGESRGRWEGDTLVVETRNFKEGAQEVSRMGQTVVGGTPNMVLVERFRRIGPDTIDYRITVTDPEVWTTPWTVSLPMIPLKEGLLYEYACHEGNYALPNMLRGARAEDQKRSAAAGAVRQQ